MDRTSKSLAQGYDDSFAGGNLRNNFAVVLKLDAKLKNAWQILDRVNKTLYCETTAVILKNKPAFDEQKLRLIKLDNIVKEIYSSGLITAFKPMLSGLTSSSLSAFTESVYLYEGSIFMDWNEIAKAINRLVQEISMAVVQETESTLLSNGSKYVGDSENLSKTSVRLKKDDDFMDSNGIMDIWIELFKWSRGTFFRLLRVNAVRLLVFFGLLLSLCLLLFCIAHIISLVSGNVRLRGSDAMAKNVDFVVVRHNSGLTIESPPSGEIDSERDNFILPNVKTSTSPPTHLARKFNYNGANSRVQTPRHPNIVVDFINFLQNGSETNRFQHGGQMKGDDFILPIGKSTVQPVVNIPRSANNADADIGSMHQNSRHHGKHKHRNHGKNRFVRDIY